MIITEELKRNVWNKGIICERYPSDKIRTDACGAFMLYDKFGDRDSIFGWEIDHIIPKSFLGGNVDEERADNIINLRPLNWKNNASKSDNYPFYSASLTASDDLTTNVTTEEGKVVNERVQRELKEWFNLE